MRAMLRVESQEEPYWKNSNFNSLLLQKDTCYEGGTFKIDIEIPGEYPFKPPKVSKYESLAVIF